ncbi:MAG: 16S rRNA (cytosine(1402)-N(4))-methyltransferase RsmH [Sphingobacteriaceae bacterium]|nr:16S rRNA (cytosine(1402)-N(4))-methyltransferase RsmH [Sphingobacteriaceae bacterium]
MSKTSAYHTPVLLKACIDNLNIKPDGTYVDLTFGGGGHSNEILKCLNEKGKLFAFDQDEDALANNIHDSRFTLIPQNFRFLKNYLRLNGVTTVHGILADLGVSSHQFDVPERGFSIRFNADLDMRMNQKSSITAKSILNDYEEIQLTNIFKEYGEVQNPRKLARLIVAARSEKSIVNSDDLKKIIAPCTPPKDANKFLAKVFQALRIEVNAEMSALKECLTQCLDVLDNGSRIVIISYHSLEDRIVKNFLRSGNTEGKEEKDVIYGTVKKVFKLITTKPIIPDEKEIEINTRARSAKLRVGEKI